MRIKAILVLFLSCLTFLSIAGPNSTKEKKFTTWDMIYETSIKTVNLFPYSGSQSDYLEPPVVPISQPKSLLLSFDDLKDDADSYYVKIVHCNADWSVSSLLPVQYLYDFNEFFITDRRTSLNTKISYVHYSFPLPKVKLSGNYIVKVYRNYDEEDLILTKRFMVYENQVNIFPNIKLPQRVSDRNTGQQVDFTITYTNYEIVNPSQSIKVVIRQNNRWDNAIYNLPPLFVKENANTLDYNYFNMENGFKGGNEFHAFDISSFLTYKLNIGRIIQTNPEFNEVLLMPDKTQATLPYTLIPDIDGQYFIEHYETKETEVNPDYALVNFVLDSPPLQGRVFAIGAMSGWRLDPEFELIYNEEINKYTCRTLLKQGYYNYKYTLVTNNSPYGDDVFFSGSHSQTQNKYDILAYYRPPGERADRLIGYKQINFMAR